jgi:hypothetical protein
MHVAGYDAGRDRFILEQRMIEPDAVPWDASV